MRRKTNSVWCGWMLASPSCASFIIHQPSAHLLLSCVSGSYTGRRKTESMTSTEVNQAWSMIAAQASTSSAQMWVITPPPPPLWDMAVLFIRKWFRKTEKTKLCQVFGAYGCELLAEHWDCGHINIAVYLVWHLPFCVSRVKWHLLQCF